MKIYPEHLKISIGGYTGPSYFVELDGERLLYTSYESGFIFEYSQEIYPTEKEWRNFRTNLDKLNVWEWKKEYPNENCIIDGTQWEFEVAYEDRELFTHGDNNYPYNKNESINLNSRKDFDKFLRSIVRLIAGLDFG
jgi:hypothetical protein